MLGAFCVQAHRRGSDVVSSLEYGISKQVEKYNLILSTEAVWWPLVIITWNWLKWLCRKDLVLWSVWTSITDIMWGCLILVDIVCEGLRQLLQGKRDWNSTAGSFLSGFWKRMLLAVVAQWCQRAVAFKKAWKVLVSYFWFNLNLFQHIPRNGIKRGDPSIR